MNKRIGLTILVAFLLLHHAKPRIAERHRRMHEWRAARRRAQAPQYV